MKVSITNTINTSIKSLAGSSPPEYSLSLDGVSDFVTFTERVYNVYGAGSDASISFWAKRTDNNDEASILGHSSTAAFKRLYFDADGNRLDIESDQNAQIAHAPVTQDTNWHHYVITWAGSDGGGGATVTMYEDGNPLSVTNSNFGVSSGKHLTVDIIGGGGGGDQSQHDKEFKGLLYQLGIWNVVLSSNAVTEIYNSGTPISLQDNKGNYTSSSDLVNLWKFDEGSGSSTTDSIESLVGTFQGNATFSSTTP